MIQLRPKQKNILVKWPQSPWDPRNSSRRGSRTYSKNVDS